MELIEKLRNLSSEVEWRLTAAKRSEASTSQFLVMPFFNLLGYNVHNPNHVEPEFTADVGIQREKVDFALMQDGKPVILVEVKYAGANLDNQHAAQLRRYFSTKLDVNFGILSNGLEFRFFSDLELQNVMDDEPFLTIDLEDLDESLIDVLEQFSRTGFEKTNAIQAARSARDRQRIRRTLKAEFDPLSDRTINFVLRMIQPGEFEESRRSELAILVKQEWRSISGLPKRPPKPDRVDRRDVRPVSLDVLEIPVFAEFNGHRFDATLVLKRDWGLTHYVSFVYDDKPMTHMEAAKLAVQSIDPTSFAYQPAWTFWHFKHPETGEKLPIKRLDRNDPLHHWYFEHHQNTPGQ